jgi:hypothetical protein
MNVDNLQLGKKLGVVHDRRTLEVRALLTPDVPRPPGEHDIAHNTHDFPMFRNDAIGDCGVASYGHMTIGLERSSGQYRTEVMLSDDDIVRGYSGISGYDPRTGARDNGIYLLDGANYFRRVGVGRQKNGEPHKILAFARVDHTDEDEVKLASYLFGGLYIGAGLPDAAAQQIRDDREWDLSGDPRLDRFGSWGGHAMWAPKYDRKGGEVVTWGQRQRFTWRWWHTYVDEVYAFINPDYMRSRSGRTPQGFDVEKLTNFLKTLG